MNKTSRTISSLKSLSSTIVLQVSKQFLEFIVRTVFIHFLAVEYLGVNGLFNNILTCLSLAELGVGSALVYSMYKPMAEGNVESVKTYMNAYKNIYRTIGLIVISIGLLLSLFLDFFVTTETTVENLRLIFILYVLKNSASYFFAYKQAAFSVDQKQYVIINNELFVEIITVISRLLVLVLLKDFIVYLVVSIVCVYIGNIRIAHKANKEYPYLKEKNVTPLSKEERKRLTSNVSAMFLHRLSYVILGSTDSIIMSKMFGLLVVGLYSNYQILINLVKTVFDMASNSIVPSVGNYCAVQKSEQMEKLFNTVLYINIGMVAFCCTGLFNLMTPFIRIWIGDSYTVDLLLVSMISISIYIQLTMRASEMFRTATGLFVNDKYFAILQSVLNIVISIIAAKLIGPAGIFVGTAMAMLLTKFWTSPYFLYKNIFKRSSLYYYKKYISFTLVGVVGIISTTFIVNCISNDGILGFCVKLLACVVVPNACFVLLTHRSSEFKECLERVKALIKK